VLLLLLIPLASSAALAENIDPNNNGSSYAWAENLGWINLQPGGPGGPGVLVSDAALSGWAWSENAGWISLSCMNFSCLGTNYGVTNDAAGTLTGYAWSENAGWINFAPSGAGVLIDRCTGIFSGRAWSENAGWITFSSTGPNPYQVATLWSRVGATDLMVNKAGGGVLLTWSAVSGATPFDIVRGGLSTLRSTNGNFQTATQQCTANNTTATSLTTGGNPTAGDGYWFLVRGSTCGGAGTYDDGTQVGSRGAGIDTSEHGCPTP
jgi:hypothetical protein